ncbi:unnamed protein product [Calypogeia fissa]
MIYPSVTLNYGETLMTLLIGIILRQYTFCAKKADCSTKYRDKPIWNTTSRLCEPCDPLEGCMDTGDVRFHFPQPRKPVDCGSRGAKVKGEPRCTCKEGWVTDFTQNPADWKWCSLRDWNHIYHVRRRAYEKSNQDYNLVLLTSLFAIILSFFIVLCFLSLLRKGCRKIFPLHQPRRRFKRLMHHGGKHVP